MLKKIGSHKKEAALVLVVVLLLAMIRNFENELFYDPLLNFFKADYLTGQLPLLDTSSLFFGLGLRYFLNSVLSLVILYVIFKENDLVKFAGLLYIIFFVVLILSFFMILQNYSPEKNRMLFYVRRFIIQPIFLLLFLPAFYYQKQILKKKH